MSRPITVLVIGPTQNGKSTFINEVRSLASDPGPEAKVGDGNFSCTKSCRMWDLDVPTTQYKLVSLRTGADVDIPKDEELLFGKIWRSSSPTKCRLEPIDPSGPRIRLRLIDTPGLDDTDGRDAENIAALAECLAALAHTEYPKVSALLFVCDANSAFSDSFQRTYQYYQTAMPNLFGGLAILNTKFTVATWAEKREFFGFQLPQESAKEREMNERRSAFSKLFNRNPHHFFIDSVPNPGRLFEELITLNTIAEIFNFIGGRGEMEIGQMLFPKTDKMIAVDARVKYLLTGVKSQWETECRRLVDEMNSETQRQLAANDREKKECDDDVEWHQKELERYDNSSEFTLDKYTNEDDPSLWQRLQKIVLLSKFKNSMSIKENYDRFDVEPIDGIHSSWTSHTFDKTTKTWTGHYEANVGHSPRVTARSYTQNRYYYADSIKEINRKLAKYAQRLDRLSEKISNQKTPVNPKVGQLNSRIGACERLLKLLSNPCPPLKEGFDDAARTRYAKTADKITFDDVVAMVKIHEPGLMSYLTGVGREFRCWKD